MLVDGKEWPAFHQTREQENRNEITLQRKKEKRGKSAYCLLQTRVPRTEEKEHRGEVLNGQRERKLESFMITSLKLKPSQNGGPL